MSGSNARCCTSEPGRDPISPDGLIEEDGFITVVATGWTRTSAKAPGPETDPEPPAPPEPA
ncbi:hypothetical protein IQ03_01304 [Gemmobacter caeni]|jgi:hypothetical protein|uniref:Uncharacterized protein n=1 Tax=Gemmobacter caeni TaxID=589035 RepID=A0A2T6B8Q9_9RHOB|nr:hypothetical protein C8N34_102223 [Gemmobacter caeni]TWJ02886.1 hypothetical protein IQ03_01304 [Gemmobacter caeni]